jgi:polysaccharide export outer membrane protein
MNSPMRALIALLLAIVVALPAWAQHKFADYPLGSGDLIRIQVFQNPDLTIETRVSESGLVSYPLIGTVKIGGLTLDAAEKEIARLLMDGGFVRQPQVNIALLANRGNQVAVLGQVNRPGRFPLDNLTTRLTDMLATAGGIAPTGADTAVVVGTRGGKPFRKEVDIAGLFLNDDVADDVVLAGDDTIYVHRAPTFYIYGEAQRPGAYRIERNMTVEQALALGGGPTQRGSATRLRLDRHLPDGSIKQLDPQPNDLVQADDVIYVRESIF